MKWIPVVLVWILPFILSTTPLECEGFFGIFLVPCDGVPRGINFSEVLDRIGITRSGKIYHIESCGSVSVNYEVPGNPPLHGIVKRGVAQGYAIVGNEGTIVTGIPPTWSVISGPTTHNLWDVCRVGNHPLYAVGDTGTIIKSTDNGDSWFLLPSPTTENLYGLECSSNGSVLIYGGRMKGFKSTDGGSSWDTLSFYFANPPDVVQKPGGPDLRTSFFFNPDTGYIFGEFGAAFFTTNGGEIWRTGIAPGFSMINTSYFISPDTGVVAGDNGTIKFTTDQGMTWFEDSIASTLSSNDIRSITVRDDSVAVLVGDSGKVVFIARDSSLLAVDEPRVAVPREFRLEQNYPNPFNPTTDIEYQIPNAGRVTLKVFDVLGRVVATLVDEVQEPGYKSRRWNASGLASGIYFYRLQTEGFVQTRKLVLQK